MLSAQAHYEVTEPDDLADVEMPTLARGSSWDLTMQVRHDDDGLWHRRSALYGYTACGKEANHRTTSNVRTERYDERLCECGCFSDFELLLSARLNRGESIKTK